MMTMLVSSLSPLQLSLVSSGATCQMGPGGRCSGQGTPTVAPHSDVTTLPISIQDRGPIMSSMFSNFVCMVIRIITNFIISCELITLVYYISVWKKDGFD